MATGLNIGNLNFGVDANTDGLRKAVRQLDAFQKKTDAIAKSQSKGSDQVTKAMARQESAIKKAFQQTLALQQQQRKLGANNQQIINATKSFKTLTREMTSGKLTTIEFTRAQDAFAARMGRSRRAINRLRSASVRSGKGLSRLKLIMRDLESSSVLAVGPLSGIGARIRAISVIAGRGSLVLAAWVAGVVLAIAAVIKLAAAILRSTLEMEKFQARFELATGSMEGGRREMNFVLATAKDLGLNLNALGRGYSRLTAASRGTVLEGQKTRDIFTSVANAAAALRLGGAEVEGIFRAIEQMMSKGTVQAEELRGQLGERLPGAFRLAAEAMGVTTKELGRLLKAGEVLSDDFLPKLAKAIDRAIGDKAKDNANSLGGSIQALNTTWKVFLKNTDDFLRISDLAVLAIKSLTSDLEFLGGAIDRTGEKFDMFASGFALLKDIQAPLQLTKAFDTMHDAIDRTAVQGDILQNTLLSLGGTKGPEELLRFFTNLTKVTEGTPDDFEAIAAQLSKVLGRDVAATVFDITQAWTDFQTQVAASQTIFDAAAKRAANTVTVLKTIPAEIEQMKLRLAELRKGPGSVEVFDKFTSVINEVEAKLKASGVGIEEQIRLLNEYGAVLAAVQAQEIANDAATKQADDRARALERTATGVARVVAETERLIERTRALATGSDGLRVYEAITQDLMRLREQLEKVTDNEALITRLLEMRRDVLTDLFRLQDGVAAAAQQAANAMANGLERVIAKGEHLNDVLKELARELFRVFLRATLLDPLIKGLTNIFSTGFRKAGIGTQTGNEIAPGIPLAHGGSFTVPGSGGQDDKFIPLMLKSGEEVSVRRPDQMSGAGGGGPTIVIHAPGADAGTIERIREMIQTEMIPQILQASTDHTMARIRRPRFA